MSHFSRSRSLREEQTKQASKRWALHENASGVVFPLFAPRVAFTCRRSFGSKATTSSPARRGRHYRRRCGGKEGNIKTVSRAHVTLNFCPAPLPRNCFVRQTLRLANLPSLNNERRLQASFLRYTKCNRKRDRKRFVGRLDLWRLDSYLARRNGHRVALLNEDTHTV